MKSLEDTLKETGLPYEKHGDWALGLMPFKETNRSHAYNIHLTGVDNGGYRHHRIRCCIGPVGDGSALHKACEIAAGHKRGSICMSDKLIWLQWSVPAGVSAKTLAWQLYGATQTADDMENILMNGSDEE
jgi:hypothetical protein